MQSSLADRWVHYVGRKAVRHPRVALIIAVVAIVLLALGALTALYGLQENARLQGEALQAARPFTKEDLNIYFLASQSAAIQTNLGTFLLIVGLLELAVALLEFERGRFYRIIEHQREQIAALKAERNTLNQ